MSRERYFGLQWRLAAFQFLVGLLVSALMAAMYIVGVNLGLEPVPVLGAGLALGVIGGLGGAVAVYILARPMKHRLREAGDMAGRIARGQFGTRLDPGPPDEIGWLEQQLNEMAVHLETAVAELRELAEQNRLLADEVRLGAALAERASLARDLHDTVNQHLFVLTMRMAAARRQLERIGGESGTIAAELANLEELARQAHGQTRELILQLRPTTWSEQGLGVALREYAEDFACQSKLKIEINIDPSINARGRTGEILFRVAQESLHNIDKHARAHRVEIRLVSTEDGIMLSIKDDGVGFDPKATIRPTAVGLVGMKERVVAVGGRLNIVSSPGRGTEIVATLPEITEGE